MAQMQWVAAKCVNGWGFQKWTGKCSWWTTFRLTIGDHKWLDQCRGWKGSWRQTIHNFIFRIGISKYGSQSFSKSENFANCAHVGIPDCLLRNRSDLLDGNRLTTHCTVQTWHRVISTYSATSKGFSVASTSPQMTRWKKKFKTGYPHRRQTSTT